MTFGVQEGSVRFGHTWALREVSLAAEPGRVAAVVGGDGAGKSTLLRALVGEVALDAGTLTVPPADRVGYLPARAGSWLELSVQENVEFVGGVYGLTGGALAGRAEPLLRRTGLADVRGRLAGRLSGGMRRKLGVVLAMLPDPELLVLDEPSTGVDPVSRVDLWRLVSEAAAGGAAVVISTTYLDEAQRCSTLLVLDAGHTLVAGTPAGVLASLPGSVVVTPEPTRPDLAWRRGREVREWWPPGAAPPHARAIRPDLEDVVVASTLRRHAGGEQS